MLVFDPAWHVVAFDESRLHVAVGFRGDGAGSDGEVIVGGELNAVGRAMINAVAAFRRNHAAAVTAIAEWIDNDLGWFHSIGGGHGEEQG